MLHELLIDKDNTRSFETLIPSMYVEDLKNERIYGVATFDGRIEPESLVGVVLVRVRFQWQEIVWVALTEKYSDCEYAADIIRNRAEDARDKGFLLGTYSEFPAQEVLRREYFDCAGFSYEIIPSHTFSVYTHVLKRRPAKLSKADMTHCFTLEEITASQKEELDQKLSKATLPTPLEVPVDWDSYDPKASVLYVENGSIVSAILICKNSDFYSIEGIYGNDPKTFEVLFMYLRLISRKVMDDRPYLIIPSIDQTVEEGLINSPIAFRDELAQVCLGYENVKKRKVLSNEDLKEYAKRSDAELLGINGMNVCESIERIDMPIDGGTLAEFSYDALRKKEAVHERHYNKIERWCQRIGLPPIMLIVQMLARRGYKLYREGKAEAVGLSGLGFTVRPLSTIEERNRMTAQFAGLILTEQQLHEKLKNQPKNTIEEQAIYEVDKKIANTISQAVESFYALTGINIHTGEKIPASERVTTAIKSRAMMSKFNRLTREYDIMVAEEMIRRLEKDEDFQNKLKAHVDELVSAEKSEIEAEWQKVRELDCYGNKKDKFDAAMKERFKLKKELCALTGKIDVLCQRPKLKDSRQLLNDLYFYRMRTLKYYIDSVDGYIEYLKDGSPIGAMHGIYIRQKLDTQVPCPDPNVKLENQIERLEPRYKDLAPWEMDGATILLGWERMLYRTGRKRDISNEGWDFEECKRQLTVLEYEKEKHPELFRELILTNLFVEIPELMDLFDKAKTMRDAASRLMDINFTNLEEKYDIYQRSLAIYDTLLRRARHIIVASHMTMNELMNLNPDFHTTDFDYCRQESVRISDRR